MEHLVVGVGPLEMRTLSKEIETSKTFVVLVRNWKKFGDCLEVNEVKLLDLERRLKLGEVQLGIIPREIIKIWKAEKGTGATLMVLYGALVECGVKDIAETLFTKFLNPESIQKREQVNMSQNILEERILQGTLPYQQPIELIRKEVNPPPQPTYYVPRTLFYHPTTELKATLFTSALAKKNVFLFKGMNKNNLAKLTGYQAVDTSGNQLHRVSINFIILECDEDFDRICKVTEKPVHMIQIENGRLFWVKSHNNLDHIRLFLKDPGITTNEQELVSKIISLSPPCAINIADSPGMGKTFVLANLALNIQQAQPHTVVLFIVLQEFVQQVNPINSSVSAIEAIVTYSSRDCCAKAALLKMLGGDNGVYNLNLFLDGYDEVMPEKLDIVDSFLKHVQKLKNLKLIITTRPHLRDRLEIIFNQFSYEILPFNDSNQITFLIQYWIDQHETKECQNLNEFARQCLEALGSTFTDTEKAITGIPLQCMILAEVYADDALRACSLKFTLPKDAIKPITFFVMYQKLVEKKLKKIVEYSSRQNYLHAHVYEAILLLFPNWIETFKPFLIEPQKVDSNALYAIGLLEKSPNENTPRFIHRTFAEYILAEFIVNNLEKHIACVDLFFGEIFGRNGLKSTEITAIFSAMPGTFGSLQIYKLKFPAIAYFIELQLREYKKFHSVDLSLQLNIFYSDRFNYEDVCLTIQASCCNDLEWTFDYATKIVRKYENRIWPFFKTKYKFKNLPHCVVYNSNNVTLVEKVLEFTKTERGADLGYHTIPIGRSLTWIDGKKFNCTPVHIAILMGKYNMLTFFAGWFGEQQVRNYKHLLHACLRGSIDQNEAVIEEKLLIIDMLIKITRDWIEEKDNYDCTPLQQYGVNLRLFNRLLEHGADINAYSSVYGTVLHSLVNHDTLKDFVEPILPGLSDNFVTVNKYFYSDLVGCALSNGFKLINHRDKWGRTPLIAAIRAFGQVDGDILRLFHEAGADFNAPDMNGNSALFHALKRSRSIDFIKALSKYGADLNHKNNAEQNALHFMIGTSRGIETDYVLKILKFFESQGFHPFNERDSWGRRPSDLMLKQGIRDKKLLKFVRKRAT